MQPGSLGISTESDFDPLIAHEHNPAGTYGVFNSQGTPPFGLHSGDRESVDLSGFVLDCRPSSAGPETTTIRKIVRFAKSAKLQLLAESIYTQASTQCSGSSRCARPSVRVPFPTTIQNP
mgnify:CR=1 FL=1